MHTSNIQNEHDIIFIKIYVYTHNNSKHRGNEQLLSKEVMNL